MLRGCRIPVVLIATLFGFAAAASAQTQSVILGILEDNPGHYADAPHYRDVRVVFRRAGDHWEAFPSGCSDQDCLKSVASKFPAKIDWTIAFDGRKLGEVTSRTPASLDFYSDIGQQEIIGDSAPPTIGKRSTQFSGFLGQSVYRPLIAVSQPNYHDPDGWKPAQLSNDVLAVARQAFRSQFPKVENCTKHNTGKAAPWSYPGTNIELKKAYVSNRKWFLATLSLTGNLCDGPPDDAFQPQWFVITPQHEVRWLDSDIRLVDAGDYDNDGRSELVFLIDGYNRGGYKLFYDDFRQSAVFEFSYH